MGDPQSSPWVSIPSHGHPWRLDDLWYLRDLGNLQHDQFWNRWCFPHVFFRAALMPRKSFKSTCRGTLMDAGELLMGRGPILETHRNFYWGWFTVAKPNLLMSLSFLSMKNPCPSNFSHGVWATILRLWGQSWGTIFDHLQKQPASTKSLPRTDVPD